MSNSRGDGWGPSGPLKVRWDRDHDGICALLVEEGWEILPSEAPLVFGDQVLGTIGGRRGEDEVGVGLSVGLGGEPLRAVGNAGCLVHKEPGRAITVLIAHGEVSEALARRLLAGRSSAQCDVTAIDGWLAAEGFIDDPDERRQLVEASAIGPLVRVTCLARRVGTCVALDLFAYPEESGPDTTQVGVRERGTFTVQEGETSLRVRAGDLSEAEALLTRLRAALQNGTPPWWRKLAARLGWGRAGVA